MCFDIFSFSTLQSVSSLKHSHLSFLKRNFSSFPLLAGSANSLCVHCQGKHRTNIFPNGTDMESLVFPSNTNKASTRVALPPLSFSPSFSVSQFGEMFWQVVYYFCTWSSDSVSVSCSPPPTQCALLLWFFLTVGTFLLYALVLRNIQAARTDRRGIPFKWIYTRNLPVQTRSCFVHIRSALASSTCLYLSFSCIARFLYNYFFCQIARFLFKKYR